MNTWQGATLLALAGAGALSAGGALRSFAHQNRRAGWLLATVFAVAFAGWSMVVDYSAIVAVVALGAGMAALWFAGTSLPPSEADAAQGESMASTMPRAKRLIWNSVVSALPFISGLLFYWWLKISPKIWIDPRCGLAGWLPLTFIPFIAIPAFSAWSRTRMLGKSKEAAVAAVVVATAVTIGVAILAFLVWFGMNQCGE